MPSVRYNRYMKTDKHRQIDRDYQRKKRARLLGYKAEEYRMYCERFPEKVHAQQKLNRAVQSGKIKRLPCVVCGATYRIHGHHEDYSKSYKVIWLCTLHHKQKHK